MRKYNSKGELFVHKSKEIMDYLEKASFDDVGWQDRDEIQDLIIYINKAINKIEESNK